MPRSKKNTESADRCCHVNRVSVHPSIRVGGASIGQCEKECLPGMTVCLEHANKESLGMLIRQLSRVSDLQFVEENRVKVCPVLNSSGVVEKWFAGYRSLSPDGVTNIVGDNDFVFGRTLHEAITNLRKVPWPIRRRNDV